MRTVKGTISDALAVAVQQGRKIVVAKNHNGSVGLILVDAPDSVLEMSAATADQLWLDLGAILGKAEA